jgi:predicted amidophosphoribosyltransferase
MDKLDMQTRNVIRRGFHSRQWEAAQGVICPKCKREVFRIIDGLCPECRYQADDNTILLKKCLNGSNLTLAEYRSLWKPEYDNYLIKLVTIAIKRELHFNSRLNLYRWTIFRYELGVCVIDKTVNCPCLAPELQGCPLLRKLK